MCRMILGAGSVSVDYLVDGLQHMATHNGQKHEDGWGIAYRLGPFVHVTKSPDSCLADLTINAYRELRPKIVMLHARNASKEVSAENTHPFKFTLGGVPYAFCHNSWFSQPIPGEGDEYDPKRFLAHVQKFLSPGEEEVSVARALAALDGFAGANCMLMRPDKAVVAVRYNQKPEYYQMAISEDSNGVMVSSEQLPGRSWKPLADYSLASITPDGRAEYADMRRLIS